jgi:hypothetical protein
MTLGNEQLDVDHAVIGGGAVGEQSTDYDSGGIDTDPDADKP